MSFITRDTKYGKKRNRENGEKWDLILPGAPNRITLHPGSRQGLLRQSHNHAPLLVAGCRA